MLSSRKPRNSEWPIEDRVFPASEYRRLYITGHLPHLEASSNLSYHKFQQ